LVRIIELQRYCC